MADWREVEERLIEAWGFLMRMPDREAGWLRVSLSTVWAQMIREQSDYREASFARGGRAGLKASEVSRMHEALGWLDIVRPADRLVIGRALPHLARGAVEVPWAVIAREIAWEGTPDALRMRYVRAMRRIQKSLKLLRY